MSKSVIKKVILKISTLVFLTAIIFAFSSCGKDEDSVQKQDSLMPSEIELPIIE